MKKENITIKSNYRYNSKCLFILHARLFHCEVIYYLYLEVE